MFAELSYTKPNRFKANKGVKYRRPVKHDETWKKAKNIALQTQSRRENQYDEETLQPERRLSRWEQHAENDYQIRLQRMYRFWEHRSKTLAAYNKPWTTFESTTPLGAGW